MTPERAKELAVAIAGRMLTHEEDAEIATILESHARMIGAGLPDSLGPIAERVADPAPPLDIDDALSYLESARADGATLLDAVQANALTIDTLTSALAHSDADNKQLRIQIEADGALIELAKAHPRCLACKQDFDTADEVRVHARSCPGHEVCQLLRQLNDIRDLWHSENGDGGPSAPSARDCMHMAQGEIKELRGEQDEVCAMVRIWANGEPEGPLSARMVLRNIAVLLGVDVHA